MVVVVVCSRLRDYDKFRIIEAESEAQVPHLRKRGFQLRLHPPRILPVLVTNFRVHPVHKWISNAGSSFCSLINSLLHPEKNTRAQTRLSPEVQNLFVQARIPVGYGGQKRMIENRTVAFMPEMPDGLSLSHDLGQHLSLVTDSLVQELYPRTRPPPSQWQKDRDTAVRCYGALAKYIELLGDQL